MSKNRPSRSERLEPSVAALALPLLVAACATGIGPSPDQPVAPEEVSAESPAPAQAPAFAQAELVTADPAATTSSSSPVAAEASPVAAYLADPAAITAGRRMFRAVCTGYCHSTTAGVTKDAPNLFDCDWDHGGSDADLFRVVSQGVPDTEMLPFDGKIPEDTIWQVIAYVRSNASDCS